MEKSTYDTLINKIKIFEKNIVNLPISGQQTKHNLIHITDNSERFKLVINRKGHRNPDNLTILLNSISHNSPMIRFDVNGSDHPNPPNETLIPTPHLHIFTEEYDNGKIVIPLSELTDEEVIGELQEALDFFMEYSNIDPRNVNINPSLL